jgi:hypothetical protein
VGIGAIGDWTSKNFGSPEIGDLMSNIWVSRNLLFGNCLYRLFMGWFIFVLTCFNHIIEFQRVDHQNNGFEDQRCWDFSHPNVVISPPNRGSNRACPMGFERHTWGLKLV